MIGAVRKLSAEKTLKQNERGHREKSGAQKDSVFTRPVSKGGKSETERGDQHSVPAVEMHDLSLIHI